MTKKQKIFGLGQRVKAPELVEKFLHTLILDIPKSGRALEKRKYQFSSENKVETIQNRDLIFIAKKLKLTLPPALEKLIMKRAVRTISGVSPIGILTKPYPCPGQCIYCPTEDRMPKSYMSNQPAAARAVRNKFHPYRQVQNRVQALEESGHPTSKLEIIVMGGTWSFLPHLYQSWYIRKCFEAANELDLSLANDFVIRPFRKEDLEAVLSLEKSVLEKIEGSEISSNQTFGKIDSEYDHFFVGVLEGQIITFGAGKIIKKESLEISRLIVKTELQRSGYGKKLANKLLETAHAEGIKKASLNFSSELSPVMEPFCLQLGFKKIKEEEQRIFYTKKLVKSLQQAQLINETTERRIIGLTLETRPDFITEKELKRMREYGCTRIEIGVQTLDEEVQKLTRRGHYNKHVARAMKLMKEYGFKVCFHLMPGLPGSNTAKDLEWMKEVFENADYKPDFIKIYPCLVLETAELKSWWEDGRYEPYEDAELVKLLTQFQTFVPEWTRIMRLMRDVPLTNILGGAKMSNLRQILKDQPLKLKEIVGDEFYNEHNLAENHYLFRDIRAREVGFADLSELQEAPILVRRDYDASGGTETFLSFESPDKEHLYALLRLRRPDADFEPRFFKSVLRNAALIREVHSYGSEISIGEDKGLGQHRGLGRQLIEEAERIAQEEWGLSQMSIIAGVGTREYYRKWGYELRSTYMNKKF